MKKTLLNIALTSALLAAASTPLIASAKGEVSANVGVTSNYLWRGLEQTNGKSAVSGGIDYAADSGFYVGTWVSNADWADGMTYELDIYGGFAGDLNESVSYDVGFVHYAYPDSADDVDFTEVNASLSFGLFSISYAVLADAEGVDFGDDSYISADAEFELSSEVALSLHIGTGTDDFYAGEDFVDYGISLSKDGFTFGASSTDLDGAAGDTKFYVSYAIDINL